MMKEYTAKEIRKLKENPYTYKVTKNKLYFTAEFKEAFWNGYQAGVTPRKLLSDLGYDLSVFGQKQIDSIVQRIRKQAETGSFTEGENRSRRVKVPPETADASPESITRMWNELKYLRQEVEFLKKLTVDRNSRKGKK